MRTLGGLIASLAVLASGGCEALLPGAGAAGVVLDSIITSAPEDARRHEAYAACRDKESALANGDVCLCAIEFRVHTPTTASCFLEPLRTMPGIPANPLPPIRPAEPPAVDRLRPPPSAAPPDTPPPGALREAEGTALEPYPDINGVPHIGTGHRITAADAELLLQGDWAAALAGAERVVGADTWDALGRARREAVAELAFTLGATGLAGFTDLVDALQRGHYANAAAEVLDSDWARQVRRARAERIADAIRHGDSP